MKQRIQQRAAVWGMPGNGFTIIEVILVVLIIGIAAAVVVPMASSAGGMQLRAAVNMVAADLEYAKSMAISRGQPYSVVFDKTTETYRVVDQADTVIPHPVTKKPRYEIDFRSESRLSQVEILDVSFNGTNQVRFDYLGSPYDKNHSPLNSGVITLQSGTMRRTVSVEPVTGFISVSN